MELREREPQMRDGGGGSSGGVPGAGDSARRRERGAAFLAAADQAVQQALVEDAETFLEATDQEGGE